MRILPEWVVHTMIGLEQSPRNRTILKLVYIARLRVSQLPQLAPALFAAARCGWSSVGGTAKVVKHAQLGYLQLYGKNYNPYLVTRQWESGVFTSRKKQGHLTEVQVNRIVKAALQVPGLEPEVAASVSPHWLRHAHASHAILSRRSCSFS